MQSDALMLKLECPGLEGHQAIEAFHVTDLSSLADDMSWELIVIGLRVQDATAVSGAAIDCNVMWSVVVLMNHEHSIGV